MKISLLRPLMTILKKRNDKMGVITLLVVCEVLGAALLKFTSIEDAYIIISMAVVIVGAFWKLKMEQQKIRQDNERLREEYQAKILELLTKTEMVEKQLSLKVDANVCSKEHKESKQMFNEINGQITKMGTRIEENHAEVLNTIIQLLHTKEDRTI